MRLSPPLRAILVMAVVTAGASACSSSGNKSAASTTTAATDANKAAFCSANITIDKAGNNVNSAADFINVLKSNQSALATLQADAPAGQVGTEAKALVAAANKAVAANDPSGLAQVPSSYGGDVDTYCGVDTNGNPLPSFFAKGKGSQFCNAVVQIDAGTSNAQSAADVLTFLKNHQSLVDQAGANASGLPSPVDTEAQTLVTQTKQAIAANSADALGTDAFRKDSSDVSLYCGDNQ